MGRAHERRAGLIERWLTRYAQRRLSKELREYRDPPEMKQGLFRRKLARGNTQQQVFRSLIQVNVYRH